MWKTGGQFSLQREGLWDEGHPTVKQMPCYKNTEYLLWRPQIGKKPRNKKEAGAKWRSASPSLVVAARPLPRNGVVANDHGAPEAGQLPKAGDYKAKDRKEIQSRQRASGAKSPYQDSAE